MISKIILQRNISLGTYNVDHKIIETSKMSDYDYDYDHPERRFYMNLLHRLSFYDSITNVKTIDIEFMTNISDTIIEILKNIKEYQINQMNPIVIKEKSIRIPSIINSEATIILSILNSNINFDICYNDIITKISFGINMLDNFLWVMSVEQEDLSTFEMQSGNDGW